MRPSLTTFTNKLILEQSELYGDEYKKVQTEEIHTFNGISINDVGDWYNSLLMKYSLNSNQVKCLQKFFNTLEYILSHINPDKLNFENDLVEEVDLMLWRESPKGISKLVFDEYGQVVYMFNGNDGSKQKGIFDITVDMEKLLYRFISK